MFTGLVEALGTIESIEQSGSGRTLTVRAENLFTDAALGDSIAINGCCLTIVRFGGTSATFEAGPETLAKTNLGQLQAGDRVNLERAMRADGRLGGHIVQGHVDGTATISKKIREQDWETIWFDAGPLTREMVPKGSVTVDGVSLTVVEVADRLFSVALIPHTLAVTTLGIKRVGDTVNIETDILGKYVLKYLGQITSGLTLDHLRAAGFTQ